MSNWRRGFSHPAFLFVLRVLLACLLLYTGFVKMQLPRDIAGKIASSKLLPEAASQPLASFAKLQAGHDFAEKVAGFRLLPPQGNQAVAVILPWEEILAGLFLLLGIWLRPASWLSAAMFTAFGIAVSIALARGLDIECGCFGTATGTRAGMHTLIIDLSGLAAALWLAHASAARRATAQVVDTAES